MHIMRFPRKKKKKRLMKKTHLAQLAGAYLFPSCNVLIHYRITPPLFIYLFIWLCTHLTAWITTELRRQWKTRTGPTPPSVDLVIRLISIVYTSNLLSACTNLNLISLPICCMEAGGGGKKKKRDSKMLSGKDNPVDVAGIGLQHPLTSPFLFLFFAIFSCCRVSSVHFKNDSRFQPHYIFITKKHAFFWTISHPEQARRGGRIWGTRRAVFPHTKNSLASCLWHSAAWVGSVIAEPLPGHATATLPIKKIKL